MMHLTEVKTVGDYLRRAADICLDHENHKNFTAATLLDAMTHVGYQHESGMGGNSIEHELWRDHLRVRAMDMDAQLAVRESGHVDLFQPRNDRTSAAAILRKAAEYWDGE